MGLFVLAVLSQYPRIGRSFATAHPPLVSGSARGISLVVPRSVQIQVIIVNYAV